LKLINNSKTLATFTANNLDQIIINSKHYDNSKNIEQINAMTKLDEESKLIWHRRLGHFYHNNLEKYLKIHKITEPLCIDCKVSKMKKKPHNQEVPKATQILEVIHSDIIGPLNESINGYRFIITFIDEKSRKGWVYNLRHKSEAIDIIIYTLKLLNNLFEKFKIKKFKSDQGREYRNSKIINFCKENGIYKEYSPPYNPENNGLAERFNQTIISCAKTLIYWSKLSSNFWDYAIIYSNYLYNNTPHSRNNFEIPNEIFYNKLVEIKHIRTFGCITYYKNINSNKLEPNARKGIFLGFKESSHSYIVMDFSDYKIHQVREIYCLENKPANLSLSNIHSENNIHNNFLDFYITNLNLNNIQYSQKSNKKLYIEPHDNYENNNSQLNSNNFMLTNNKSSFKRKLSIDHNFTNLTQENKRHKIINNFNYDEYYNNSLYAKFNDSNKNHITTINLTIPLNYNDAINSHDHLHWEKAIKEELKNFYFNNIMEFVPSVPKGKTLISTKWIFSVKRDSNNNIIKHKARLVARGFNQIYGIDFELTYSPTLNIDGLKFIISLAAKFSWNIFQLDIKAAYLYAPLDREIYTSIPPGDHNYNKGYWRLHKALYGLKQSGRQWNCMITNFLINHGFIQLSSEKCIFKKTLNKKLVCIIGLYVDDMIITGEDYEIKSTIKIIRENFKISKCGEIDCILGINVHKSHNNTYSLSQENYIKNILEKYNINNLKKSKTPCTGTNTISENNTLFDKTIFKSAIGGLIFLARCTRPDIAFAVNKAARKCEEPTVSDWKKIINIFKYLNSTSNYKITYHGKGDFIAYSDSDFAGDINDRKSTSGYIILMGKSPICWSSRKQSIVATSTTEAEYISTSECIKKVLWVRNLIKELFGIEKEITVFTDNLSSKTTMENGDLNTKLKHIDIKYHFNKDNIDKHKIKLEYVNTENMIADILTKDVNGNKMTSFTNIIFN